MKWANHRNYRTLIVTDNDKIEHEAVILIYIYKFHPLMMTHKT